ncbi:nicotinamide riboside kinase 1 [Agrilus planipennis]|uniref:Nicotinamide riboside kinase 1 n=1 Tax=Agrilus planipennis TaxID=224129 RepID=A0A1W4XJ61_AGRPL|nr:nicotinamide riboside kinase 1 [Agrilus planipennis]XP_025830487.1 nicotinamide riboside kinase 1 [Agrilus planipennis]
MCEKWLIIGISGTTCGGKTTLANNLHDKFPIHSKVISQDDYFFEADDPRLEDIPDLKHKNFDSLGSLDMEKMLKDINIMVQKRKGDFILNKFNGETTLSSKHIVETIREKLTSNNISILIIEGFCIFNYRPVADLCDLKYYISLTKDECYSRRMKRSYIPPDVPGYFEKYVWPQHLQQKKDVEENIPNVTWFDEHSENKLDKIMSDILNVIQI